MPLYLHPVEIDQEPTLAVVTVIGFVGALSPDIRTDIIECPRVPGVARHLVLSVVVPQRHIGPVFQVQLAPAEHRASIITGSAVHVLPLYLQVGDQNLTPPGTVGTQQGRLGREYRLAGDGKNAEIELRIFQPASFAGGHFHPNLLVQPQNGAGFDRTRGVVVSGDEHDGSPGKRRSQPLKLAEGEHDCSVGGTD
jgi:hypothetical protein